MTQRTQCRHNFVTAASPSPRACPPESVLEAASSKPSVTLPGDRGLSFSSEVNVSERIELEVCPRDDGSRYVWCGPFGWWIPSPFPKEWAALDVVDELKKQGKVPEAAQAISVAEREDRPGVFDVVLEVA